jgi:hypothetical protein
MKRNTLAMLLITAVCALFACNLFGPKQSTSKNLLLGKWKIDSIATGKDSSAIGYLLLAMSINDSADYDYQFEKDSLTFYGKDSFVDKATYSFNPTSGQLIINDSTTEYYIVKQHNDSITGLHGTDSSIIFLKRR